jgi:hypothetical protein
MFLYLCICFYGIINFSPKMLNDSFVIGSIIYDSQNTNEDNIICMVII